MAQKRFTRKRYTALPVVKKAGDNRYREDMSTNCDVISLGCERPRHFIKLMAVFSRSHSFQEAAFIVDSHGGSESWIGLFCNGSTLLINK